MFVIDGKMWFLNLRMILSIFLLLNLIYLIKAQSTADNTFSEIEAMITNPTVRIYIFLIVFFYY